MLWELDNNMQYRQLPSMTDAQFQGLNFPDIVQLAFLDDKHRYIAGCSSMGLLAIWHARYAINQTETFLMKMRS